LECVRERFPITIVAPFSESRDCLVHSGKENPRLAQTKSNRPSVLLEHDTVTAPNAVRQAGLLASGSTDFLGRL
jgi:hypothetical protein